MNIYKVYVYTDGHPHVSEMVVAATSEDDARERARNHIKRNNPTKGDRTPEESQDLSRVLAVKETGIDGCLVINKISVAACKEMCAEL